MLAARRSLLLVCLFLAPLLSLLLTRATSHAQPALLATSPTIVPFAAVPQARGVTIDTDGNVFSLSRDTGIIYKITPAGQLSTIADLPDLADGYVGPIFDPASGNLFVSRYAQGAGAEVLRITPAGAVSVFASGIEDPSGLAADGQGNLFVTSYNCPGGAVFRVSSAGVVNQFGTGLCHPDGVAIGPNGDLFIGDRGTQRIMRVPAAGGAASVFAVGVGLPLAVAFDQTGKLFVVNFSAGTVSSVSSNGVVSPFASGLTNPDGLAFDQQNQIYVADFGRSQIIKLEDPPPTTPTATPLPTATPTNTPPPIANQLTINGGALTTTSVDVRLDVSASNANGSSTGLSMSFSNDGATWSAWQSYAPWALWQLSGEDGLKTIYAHFKNSTGAISSIVSDTIQLDTSVQSEYSMTINNGALYTNNVAVQLTISARPHTAAMQVSNDGGFLGVDWEPYSAHKAWQITRYRHDEITRLVYMRFRDADGSVSSLYLDDIILDINAPHGYASVAEQGALLELTATDDLSGVDSMRVSAQPDFSDVNWEPFGAQRIWNFGTSPTVYVQFRDAAGNLSSRYAAGQAGASTVFLSLVLH
jgi:sugar lactone lactonase YvrE